MIRMEWAVTVDAPVRAVYDTWTQFEEFPAFMEGIEQVEQLDDTHLRWHVDVAGRRAWFEAEITEQIADARIAWRSTTEPHHAGSVDFHRLDDDRTEVDVIMDVSVDALPGTSAGADNVAAKRLNDVVAADLQRFKQLVERGDVPKGWRGEVRPRGAGESMTVLDKVAAAIVTAGALNWGLVGIARFDALGRLLAHGKFGRTSPLSRGAYLVVGATGLYAVGRLMRRTLARVTMLRRHVRA